MDDDDAAHAHRLEHREGSDGAAPGHADHDVLRAKLLGTFLRARELFPERNEFKVFQAMTYYNLSEHSKAMELLLTSLVETSKDAGILSYERAIRFYADKLDETW